MENSSTLVKKIQIEKNKIIGSMLLVAIVSAIALGAIFPVTIPYSLEIFRSFALVLFVAITWGEVFYSLNSKEVPYHSI